MTARGQPVNVGTARVTFSTFLSIRLKALFPLLMILTILGRALLSAPLAPELRTVPMKRAWQWALWPVSAVVQAVSRTGAIVAPFRLTVVRMLSDLAQPELPPAARWFSVLSILMLACRFKFSPQVQVLQILSARCWFILQKKTP